MRLGIDVGGTFTDAVVVDHNRLLGAAKSRTTHEQFMVGLLASLDKVLSQEGIEADKISQVTLSTTVVTNAIVSHHLDPVDLFVIPGPGLNIEHAFPVKPYILKGYTDHRGRLQERMKEENLRDRLDEIEAAHIGAYRGKQGIKRAALSAKFAVRNPKEEARLGAVLGDYYDFVSTGASLSGSLNFPRRTVTAYYNAAVEGIFRDFKTSVQMALGARGILAPLYILKADGGSLPIDALLEKPVETAFTGPAASVLGLYTLEAMKEYPMAVALDIGGTTTDISLWQEGKPLMTKEGLCIDGYPSSIQSFLVRSIGLAGETVLRKKDNHLLIGPDRLGPSVALGGSQATLGDALLALGYAHYGDLLKAQEAVADFDLEEVAQEAAQTIVTAIEAMVEEANRQPVYVVEDLVNPHPFQPDTLVLIGGSAQAFKPLLEAYTNYRVLVPQDAAVANALGAAMARHSLELTIHIDTKTGILTIPELGLQEVNPSIRTEEAVVDYAFKKLEEQAHSLGLEKGPMVLKHIEAFPVIEGWGTSHMTITASVQLEAGVTGHVS